MKARSAPKGPGGRSVQPAHAAPGAARPRVLHVALVVGLLALTAVLAGTSLATDSPAFDEVAHLPAGLSYLKTGDFRLSPEHPPLFKMWCAWPLLFMDVRWPGAAEPTWVRPDPFGFGQILLCALNNGQKLIQVGRCMMVLVLLGTGLAVYGLARTLFGPRAGLLALALATLHPSLLAHGRLVTTDLPITFCLALVLLTFAALLRRTTWLRVLAAALALTMAALAKLSWPLILPALAAMALVKLGQRHQVPDAADAADEAPARPVPTPRAPRRLRNAATLLGSFALIGLIVWAGIWTGYGWHNTRLAPLLEAAATPPAGGDRHENVQYLTTAWREALYDAQGRPRSGPLAAFLRLASAKRLLPEPYLYGIAVVLRSSQKRMAYFCGEISDHGWRGYFPLVFALKTPIPVLMLLAAGLAALIARRARPRDPLLLVGCLAFILVYGGYAVFSSIDIGERHLLPVYPPLLALAGAATAWLAAPSRSPRDPTVRAANARGRQGGTRRAAIAVAGGALLVWSLAENLSIHPQYLAYFNELIGGPRHAYEYFVDSSLDWGQDLRRLEAYARQHPTEQLNVCYFGAAVPRAYLPCGSLPSFFDFEPRAPLTAGTYVISVTRLVGLYDAGLRASYWTDAARAAYAERARTLAVAPPPDAPSGVRVRYEQAVRDQADWRARRLVSRLRHRNPDAYVGYTMLLFRLSDDDIAQLTSP